MSICNIDTAANIFGHIQQVFIDNEIAWSNLMILMEVFFYFYLSSNRKEKYKDFLDFTYTEPFKILKHCSARWLSLKKCANLLLHHCPAL